MSPRPDVVVVGIGNPHRRDDGVGHAVVRRLSRRPDVEVVESDGEVARLVEVLRDRTLAVVIDAVRDPDAAPGSVVLRSVDSLPQASAAGHVGGIAPALALGGELGCRPDRVHVVGVVGQDFSHGDCCSSPVLAAIDETAALVESLVYLDAAEA